ncbi:ABC transporter permease [Candidatus Parcubacteria bacterium]|nr:ABC transporter permease [Candidatus Parcubacteria bacterium]
MRQILPKKNRNLLFEMIRTDFKLRYQASILGYLWSVMKPLFMFAILYVVFAKILKLGTEPNYALSLLLGIVLFNFFAEATGGALKSVVSKSSLIRKIDIPRHLIPVASVASAFINMLLNLLVVFVFVAFGTGTAVSWMTLLVFPLLIAELVLFTIAFSFLLSAMYVKLRDIDHIWEVVRQALFYSIPVIYPLSRVPIEIVQQIMLMNPLVQIIEDARSVITYSGVVRIPDVYQNSLMQLVPIAIVFGALFIGIKYFSKRSKYFAELV